MALVKKQASAQRQVLLAAVLLLVIGGIIYVMVAKPIGKSENPVTDTALQTLEARYREMKALNQSLLQDLDKLYNDVRYQELRQYGDVPVTAGKAGRGNPFAPL